MAVKSEDWKADNAKLFLKKYLRRKNPNIRDMLRVNWENLHVPNKQVRKSIKRELVNCTSIVKAKSAWLLQNGVLSRQLFSIL